MSIFFKFVVSKNLLPINDHLSISKEKMFSKLLVDNLSFKHSRIMFNFHETCFFQLWKSTLSYIKKLFTDFSFQNTSDSHSSSQLLVSITIIFLFNYWNHPDSTFIFSFSRMEPTTIFKSNLKNLQNEIKSFRKLHICIIHFN